MASEDDKTLAAREFAKRLFDCDDLQVIPEETLALAQTLFGESDRGAVLVSAAELDESLDALIRTAMSDETEIVKRAVDPLLKPPTAPLRSFWAKTQLAYALRLIDADTYAALNDIRELRNAFAHHKAPASLSDSQASKIVKHLEPHYQVAARAIAQVVRKEVGDIKIAAPDAHIASGLRPERTMFMVATLILSAHIEVTRRSRTTGAT